MKKTVLLCLALTLMFCATAKARVKVVDGDSLEIGGKKIRLLGLDAPEYFQECYDENGQSYTCGQESMAYLQKLVNVETGKGRKVICKKEETDRYGRDLSVCYVGNVNLNLKMVIAGWAIAYRDERYSQAEKEAKKEKRGVWKGKFMRPELYRILQRYKNG